MNKLNISTGNKKLGNTLNFSVTPGLTCSDSCEFKKGGCYSLRMCGYRKNVGNSYENNYINTLKSSFVKMFQSHLDVVTNSVNYEYFRWHVGGDIYNQDYLNKIYSICKKNKNIKFFLPTASWEEGLNFKGKPANLVIKNSFGSRVNKTPLHGFKSTFVIKRMDKILQDKSFMKSKVLCKDDCTTCRQCWNNNVDIIFIKR